MGADLFIKSVFDDAHKKFKPEFDAAIEERNAAQNEEEKEAAQKKIDEAYANMHPEDGYFRDSYNLTSVIATMGLSWWLDVCPLCDEDGYLQEDGICELLHKIKDAKQTLPTEKQLVEAGVDLKKESVGDWHKYFKEKKVKLIKFLMTAATKGEPVLCSC